MATSAEVAAEDGPVESASPNTNVEAVTPISTSASTSSTTTRPGKITATFGDIAISSNFDSGNLARAEECRSLEGPNVREFDLWTSRDCAETSFENGNRTWFYFSVTTPSNCDKLLKFNIRNLNRQGRLYQQGLTPITKTVPGRGWERLRGRVDYENVEEGMRLSFQLHICDSRKLTTYFAFCYPYSYSECQRRLAKLDENFKQTQSSEAQDQNRIYYHRELVCHSLEGRRIDLITVTSWEGVSEEREPSLPCLFPDTTSERCHVFKDKKVIFVSSRVHPGETPSSFVFNGLLQFLLRQNDPRAIALRKKFVFKLVPMLNPDGVYRGHYRTDTLGANLNRYYLNPDPGLHPSIYAAKTLVLHYHQHQQHHQQQQEQEQEEEGGIRPTPRTHLHAASVPSMMDSHVLHMSLCDHGMSLGRERTKTACGSLLFTSQAQAALSPLSSKSLVAAVTSYEYSKYSVLPNLSSRSLVHQSLPKVPQKLPRTTSLQDHTSSSSQGPADSKEGVVECERDFIQASRLSGLALYVDLHAHATKRGVFMYGNYFSSVAEAAETMLLPKLLSLNSPHLDFEHCVFSERNMYVADRRDGLSKEGSGRVAVHKATGIIPCYTLECNYNSGRQCNLVTEATMDDGRASPAFPFSPMTHRFSIADFEQVGRALAISILDLYQLNPWTRLPNTSFTSLAGVKQNLVQRVHSMRTRKMPSSIPAELNGIGGEESSHITTAASGKTILEPAPQPSVPSKQRSLGISKRTGRVADVTQLAEVRQKRSVTLRVSSHNMQSSVMSCSKSASRQGNLSKKPFLMHSMKPAPTNVVFPSSLAAPQADPQGKSSSMPRKALKSGRGIIPITKPSAGGSRIGGIPASTNLRGRAAKSSVYIPHSRHQKNHVPPLYCTKEPLLKIPVTDHLDGKKALGSKQFSSLDPASLPLDRVVPTSASH